MKLCVLLSCMHQTDVSIVEKSNIQTDVIVVNQCNHEHIEMFTFLNKKGRICHVKFINTTERGLSKSRNMAIRNCDADICVLADDDECFTDDYEEKIISAYRAHPEVGVIAFSLIRNDIVGGKLYPKLQKELGFKQIFSTSSLQLTFKKSNCVYFDEKMGSGTGNGGGEENKFLFDMRRNGIKMWYFPSVIATINPSESKWFKGYNEHFFRNHGWASRRILGDTISFIYCIYYIFRMRNKTKLSFSKLLKSEFSGWFQKR